MGRAERGHRLLVLCLSCVDDGQQTARVYGCHSACYTFAHKATKHRRIAVVRDPDLDAALHRAAALLGDKPAATLVRELALRGARPADGSLLEFLDDRGAWGELDSSRRASELLDELRGDRTSLTASRLA